MLDNSKKTVLALGYFDGVHRGHRTVIERAKRLAKELDATLTVFTFEGNLRAVLSGEDEKQIYPARERTKILKELGADEIFYAPVNYNFLSMGKLSFLNMMNRKYDVLAYVCGRDYKFGKLGKGDVEYLKGYATKKKQRCIIVDDVTDNNKRISTSLIKKLLLDGNVKKANQMLERPFSITGEVIRDRQIGKELGFPTVNVNIEKDKAILLEGVYSGHIEIDGVYYRAMINYGHRPTFGLENKLIEAHIIGFSGELYGKEITLFFDSFVRGVNKFCSIEQLKERLRKDKEEIERGDYD